MDYTALPTAIRPSRPSLTQAFTENAAFTEVATVLGIWLLTIFVGVNVLASMRTILVPLFWAFFLMMGLVPATDFLQKLLMRMCGCKPKSERRSERMAKVEASDVEALESEATDDRLVSVESQDLLLEEEGNKCGEAILRMISAVLVSTIFLGLVVLFFFMIYISALHMHQNFQYYEEGAKRLTTQLDRLQKRLSTILPKDVADKMTSKALTGVEDILSSALSYILENVSSTLVEGLMMLLYMLFWLFQPMHVSQSVSVLFKQYIMLKALASAGYATCVWMLLHILGIDLAIVFGLITFLFNFVPEVGPFIAVVLPLPVVLFDARIEHPLPTLAITIGGNLILKCVWANIIEVKLVESQEEMRMHPVIILFFVAFFGWLWGPTGMLLSVPAMAVLKASMDLFPKKYRDPILITLEGDRLAPKRFSKHRSESTSGHVGTYKKSSP